MKKIYAAFFTLISSASFGQFSLTEATNTSSQNFDGIGTSQTATLPPHWRASANPLLVRTVDPYSSAGMATTQRGGENLSSSAPNGIYNFGAGDPTAATDRAIGGLSSGSNSKSVNVYHHLKNDGTAEINNFTISYDVEKYRNGTNAAGFSVMLYYSFDGSTWIEAPGPYKATFGQGVDNSGVSPAPSATTSITSLPLNVSLPVGGDIYLAWNYSVSADVITSNAIALGIDNVVIMANYNEVMPIRLADFKATQKGSAVELSWTGMNESNMERHEIQKSANGSAFRPIGNVAAQNAATTKYSFLDAVPAEGNNFYRLKFISKAGDVTYSQALKINMGRGQTNVVIAPNPVRNGNLNLQFTNLTRGKYFISLYNGTGQQVFSRSMDHPGGSSTEIIDLPSVITRGTYYMQLSNAETKITKQVFVD